MARAPVIPSVSFVERENDSPEMEQAAVDLTVESLGRTMDARRPFLEGVDIEMEDDGGAVIDFDPEDDFGPDDGAFDRNLAEEMDLGELGAVANDLLAQYESAKESRGDWEEEYSKGLELLGFKYEERTNPFRGATGVTHPLLAEAATQFQAQAFNELLPPGGPVRTHVLGEITKEKEAQAKRVKEFMNYYVTNVAEEYTPEFDQMLFYLPLAGSTFKKVYYDANLERVVSKFVPAENLVVPYDAADLETAPFVAQVLRMPANDVRKLQVAGFYSDVPVHPSQEKQSDISEVTDEIEGSSPSMIDYDVTLLEFHVDLDLPGYEDRDEDGEETGIMLPYVVTVCEDTGSVLSIRRNYKEADAKRRKIQYFVHYKFLPGFGFYGLGLIHTIGGLSRTATAALRQLIDAGTLSNLPAGFKARGLRIRDNDDPLQPGEFRDVDSPGGAIRDSLMPLPFKGPDATLFNLLGFVVQAGQRFATITDMKVGDGNQQAAVGTTVAMLEQGARVMSAVHKRLHYAMKQEFKLLARAMAESLPPQYPYTVAGADQTVFAQDFDDRVDVIPVSNPNIFSQSQRIMLAQTQMQLAMQAPELHDIYEAYRRMYEALGVRDIDKILKPKEEAEAQPKDPATENIDALNQLELQAFEGQNHDAHMMSHLVFGASGLVGQMPMVGMALQKHLMDHVRLKATEIVMAQVAQMGAGQQLPPEMQVQVEAAIANQIAQELQNLRQLNDQITGQAQQQGPDPLVALKEQELQLRAQKDQAQIAQDQAELQLDAQKAQQRAREFQERLEQNRELTMTKLDATAERERARIAAQMAMAQQRRQ
jgi:hypothetical protein